MVVERVARHVGGGEDLDVEPLEQRPRPELKGAEPLCDRVVQRARDAPDCGVRIEAAVLVEDERVRHYTTGAQPRAYSRCQNLIASSSPTMWPDLGSVRSARPVDCAMLPRWPSSTLFAPSSIG